MFPSVSVLLKFSRTCDLVETDEKDAPILYLYRLICDHGTPLDSVIGQQPLY